MTTSPWRAYFDELDDGSPLYRVQSELYVNALASELGIGAHDRVLDFGCGFGFVAALLAPQVGEVWLWDDSPAMRAAAARNTRALANVQLWDPPPDAPAEGPSVGSERTFDLIIVNSVAQYMPADELWTWLGRWRPMLASHGRLVLSDLIPPSRLRLSDAVDLLRLGLRCGSPVRATREALGGLLRYSLATRRATLTRVDPQMLTVHARTHGFAVAVLGRNLTHFRSRWSAVLR